ncbi:MAG TPA: hypothetical protein VKB18_00010 [Gemmatimonadota bacterium]|nr:hypothetical protein [Gemmatimonadota bacterium]
MPLRRFRGPVLLAVAAALAAGAASACFENPEAPLADVRPVVVGAAQVERPSVSGDRVVWRGLDLGPEAADLRTGERRVLVPVGDSGQAPSGAIDGSRVAWVMARSDAAGDRLPRIVEAGDLGGGPRELATDPRTVRGDRRPDVSGDRIVWARLLDSGNSAIYLYDASTGEVSALTDGTCRDLNPAIDGDRVEFDRLRDAATASGRRTDIMLLDLGSGELRKLNPHEGRNQGGPDVSGDIVAWAENTDGTSDVVYVDLATGRFVNVTRNLGRVAFGPRVSGSRIVWEEARGITGMDIFAYDIRTGRESRVTGASGDQQFPDIDGDRIAWVDNSASPPRIMAAELGPGP